ncbi:porin family protein [Vibrio sp. Sgm 22]|uniref:porin family protein n=1 Tax=unclassified Vibrio TaxID=2614977 RepID=UPI0022495CBC|nr:MULTISPECIES: porin family protein [unclassified Vibrio]MCX2757903.1 porin family protein [Vibrio sp. 14G-20]MCX2775308.1 porin family protein [Vibrio sp. Sgm 22]
MNNKFILSIAMMSAVAASNLMAADSGFYLGGAIGTSGIDDGGLTDTINEPITFKAEDNTYRLIAGYKFNRIVSLEAQYTDFGDVALKTKSGNKVFTWTPQIFSVTANLGYTFDNGVRPFGTIGLSTIDLDMKFADGSRPSGDGFDDPGDGIRMGVGVEYTPPTMSSLSFRLAYEADAFDIEDYENGHKTEDTVVLDSFYLGAMYTF